MPQLFTTKVPAYYSKPKEIQAWKDGFQAGIDAASSNAHPWAGKQTNFNKPLRMAWYAGYREGEWRRFAADIPHGVCPRCGGAQREMGCTNDECPLFGRFD